MIDSNVLKNMVDYTLETYFLLTALAGAGLYVGGYGIGLISKLDEKSLESKLTEKTKE
jgi:hypothetical protein